MLCLATCRLTSGGVDAMDGGPYLSGGLGTEGASEGEMSGVD